MSSVDVQNEKDVFATYEKNGWKADGKSLFLKRVGVLNSGYVSAAISKDDGTFTQNPVITRTLEAKYKSYGLFIEFGNILPKKFIIRTYADNVLNDTLVISSGIVQEFEIQYDFKEYDKMEIEFTEMPSNSRVHVNYISIGSETAYKIEYDDLYSTPIGTQLDKVKNIKVARYLYSKGIRWMSLFLKHLPMTEIALFIMFLSRVTATLQVFRTGKAVSQRLSCHQVLIMWKLPCQVFLLGQR